MIRVGRLFHCVWFYLYLKQHIDDEAFFNCCNIITQWMVWMTNLGLEFAWIVLFLCAGDSSNSCIVILNYLQMWTKLNEVGSEMISLSRSLSEISRGCFRAQVCGFLLTLGSLSGFRLLHTMLVKLTMILTCYRFSWEVQCKSGGKSYFPSCFCVSVLVVDYWSFWLFSS